MMVSTTTFKGGQVVVVGVPLSDHSGVKRRPALVVSACTFDQDLPDVIVCPISSQPRYYRRPGPGDCPLQEWRMARLRHPSTLRISKLLAIDKRIIRRTLGKVSQQDLARFEAALRRALDL